MPSKAQQKYDEAMAAHRIAMEELRQTDARRVDLKAIVEKAGWTAFEAYVQLHLGPWINAE